MKASFEKVKDEFNKDTETYRLKGQYQFRFYIFGWEFIITLIHWPTAAADEADKRKQRWEDLQNN